MLFTLNITHTNCPNSKDSPKFRTEGRNEWEPEVYLKCEACEAKLTISYGDMLDDEDCQ